ncbi:MULTISPECIES: HAD family hydrolase [Dyadobacter]|jgi:3-deoxy-D-manno-octulosonate 8-phosphate phosphatase (KDO 8-P phosphatase)|uniref:3-deoxy-D-manno-octulosonate 8-phosphate phosphatase n=1 Tax=Dyadobacter chenhuakuii TaxID=2909339 RepID=A0A9X1QD27_9BACT|nr:MULTISPECIES: 3-deoxy-D-manno-octulosonate 8-phosphate phosphatase [Dyadobacter]MCF2496034.1 3-deoxy-D-manno-octulosonate 8-phosphate phosphatase [Dyadobacter chenhuakuii]MCF2499485.1 3-deoxy-D-manno-octulosonate 8-phosphate phosphatase [Dyadobacter chenhuakuii]MCF2519985.1 3-deoxy-D-manno-octulosonate 8-phosphate phosphatase [Dyadobacter sp. CY351]USJ30101.1 3-deoxy-D-manno-octulosonate 8-phosphate phosphatase [Dyadobacter chenhuakuii]
MNAALIDRFKRITTFIFDIDGVMTDGSVIALESGEQPRSFNVKDGYGINRAIKMGYRVAIISAQNQMGVRKRLEYLGVSDIFIGTSPDGKLPIFKKYLEETNLTEDEIVFMGDDLPDYEVMRTNVLSACPADSVDEILALSDYISPKNGGHGAVRDLIEQVMKAQGKWMAWFQ